MFLRLHEFTVNTLSDRSPATVITFSASLLIIFGIIDYWIPGYTLIILYFIPVSLVSWFVNKQTGLIFCIISVFLRIFVDHAILRFEAIYSYQHYWSMVIESIFLLGTGLLFATLKLKLDREKLLARIDPLTGTLNRRAFFDLADYELKRSRRYSHPLTVIYIDLDDFKMINDRFGHHTGDKLLQTAVDTILRHSRSVDILGRMGGDEFVIMLPETGAEAALSFLEKLQEQLHASMKSNSWGVSFSIGAITFNVPPQDADMIVNKADSLMYKAKKRGKANYIHHVVDSLNAASTEE